MTGFNPISRILSIFGYQNNWKSGAEGEEIVAGRLNELGEGFRTFNDVMLPGEQENIDHIVVGQNGIFAIETKNIKGRVLCNGDNWSKVVGPSIEPIKSPSVQAKRTAAKLTKFLQTKLEDSALAQKIYTTPIIVFANKDVELAVNRQEVPVLRPFELTRSIMFKYTENVFAESDIESISSLIK